MVKNLGNERPGQTTVLHVGSLCAAVIWRSEATMPATVAER